jgi:hypothetical protein
LSAHCCGSCTGSAADSFSPPAAGGAAAARAAERARAALAIAAWACPAFKQLQHHLVALGVRDSAARDADCHYLARGAVHVQAAVIRRAAVQQL